MADQVNVGGVHRLIPGEVISGQMFVDTVFVGEGATVTESTFEGCDVSAVRNSNFTKNTFRNTVLFPIEIILTVNLTADDFNWED